MSSYRFVTKKSTRFDNKTVNLKLKLGYLSFQNKINNFQREIWSKTFYHFPNIMDDWSCSQRWIQKLLDGEAGARAWNLGSRFWGKQVVQIILRLSVFNGPNYFGAGAKTCRHLELEPEPRILSSGSTALVKTKFCIHCKSIHH